MSIFTVRMPDIGEGVVEGEVISWLKQVGDPLLQDEPVVVVMTDKATVELPAPYPGKLEKQHYKIGEIAVKDHPLYDILLDQAIVSKIPQQEKKEPEKEIQKPSKKESIAAIRGKALASPAIRKLAKDMDLDINSIRGTGPEGRVILEDLKKNAGREASSENVPHLLEDEERLLVGIHNLMAKKMALSKKEIPHFSFFDRADATRLLDFFQKLKSDAESRNVKLTLMPFFIKSLSLCLSKHPLANSSLDRNNILIHKNHNIGIAMSTELGLIVPVLKNVQKLTLFEVIYAYDELKQKAKHNQLTTQDMQDSTVTITNFGALGDSGVFATPIINFPEAAILGVAHIHSEPAVFQNKVVPRSILNCSWSFDHRIIDGDEASKISASFKHIIENPARLLVPV